MERVAVNAGEVVSKIVDGDALVIHLSTGVYYCLEGSGALVWALLERGHPLDAISAELSRRYGIKSARASADVERLVSALAEEGIVSEAGGTPLEPLPLELALPEGEYASPKLERYTDMQDLFLLDPPIPGLLDTPWHEREE